LTARMWRSTALLASCLLVALTALAQGQSASNDHAYDHPHPEFTDMFYSRQQTGDNFGERKVVDHRERLVVKQKEKNTDNVDVNAHLRDRQTRPKLPSHYVTKDHSIPADVYRFLYNAQTMVQRYPALGGIFREGTGIQHDPHDRQARLFGFNFGLDFGALGKLTQTLFGLPDFSVEGGLEGGLDGGLDSILGGGGGATGNANLGVGVGDTQFNVDAGIDGSAGIFGDASADVLAEETTNVIQHILNPGSQAKNKKTGKKKRRISSIEPCSNADGICQRDQSCGRDGRNIGRCTNCVGCGYCCTYEFEDQATTNETIVFFQSPMYPSTRRNSMASSLSIEIRKDVTQVLIEFEDFEMPIGTGPSCLPNDYIEIISPFSPNGVLGPGNNKLCGINTGQHLYLTVRPGDLLVLKAVTSGVGFVPLSTSPGLLARRFGSGANAYRFRIKVIQIIDELSSLSSKRANARDGRAVFTEITGDIPEYYERLRAPRGCLQYYTDTEGTIESFNYDGTALFPNNLKYSICFRTPLNNCGISLQALRFGIGAGNAACADGAAAVADGQQCCTQDASSTIEKYLGVDSTSNGVIASTGFATNQLRYFFCGSKLGETNFVVSSRKGFTRLQVFSDGNTVAAVAAGAGAGSAGAGAGSAGAGAGSAGAGANSTVPVANSTVPVANSTVPVDGSEDGAAAVRTDIGFKIKYELNTGIC